MALPSGLDWVWGWHFLAVCKNAQHCGKMGFYICILKIATRNSKSGSSKKGPKFTCWAVPILIFVFFGGAPGFSRKLGFPKSTDFGWNHWKRSAKVARPQNGILAREGPKEAILQAAARWSQSIFHSTAPPFPFTFKYTKRIVWFLLPFVSGSLSIILMIALLLCNKYLMFHGLVECFVVVSCICFFFCASASGYPSSFPFLDVCFFLFIPVVFFCFFLGYLSSCSCY